MRISSLPLEAGIKLGPILLETAVKHYFDRILTDRCSQENGSTTQLRQDELLYDEAFNVIKTFLEASTKHTVEELQQFSNMRTPAPPWVHVVKTCVPMVCCDDAASYLIKALGGEEMTKRVVGGTKWWQVRGVAGVDGEWMAAKKDWHEAEKRYKAQEERASSMDTNTGSGDRSSSSSRDSKPEVPADASPNYQPEMDEMRCILYIHGGGYYFGSVDQERYSIQRYARKVNGRVFAINYRLAPQYPFPCAIQDSLAAYLYLIRPPPGASHRPVKPAHIVIAGDSAGGGLSIALLQVLRDSGLPMPAGAFLISPWCDLTHSFPSIHMNTATDIIPEYGLSFFKPSTLWPPPPDTLTSKVQETVRHRIQQVMRLRTHKSTESHRSPSPSKSPTIATPQEHDLRIPETGQTLHLGSSASLPLVDVQHGGGSQTISCYTSEGESISVDDQIHLYAPNYLLKHPLISPVNSYLGGLPPLFVIASDKEVLRDEIIYFAHRAAHPDKYPVSEEVRRMYPALDGIEHRCSPTQIHLQVYDDAAHTLPVLFSFTTPAKYCYRAIATFIRHVTGMTPPGGVDTSLGSIPMTDSPAEVDTSITSTVPSITINSENAPPSSSAIPSDASKHHRSRSLWTISKSPDSAAKEEDPTARRKSFRRSISATFSVIRPSPNGTPNPSYFSPKPGAKASPSHSAQHSGVSTPIREESVDVAGPRFHDRMESLGKRDDVRTAGEPSVYANGMETMIRERVSTRGAVRPLEPEAELSAFALPPELVGVVSELAIRRYLAGKAKFDKKFHKTSKTIAKQRKRNLETAKKDAMKNMSQFQSYMEAQQRNPGRAPESFKGVEVKEGKSASGSWSWAWALDVDEHPPPSSIVSRRDTDEAVRLARIADQSVMATENMMSGNNLWSMIVNFLTVNPVEGSHSHRPHRHHHESGSEEQGEKAAAVGDKGKEREKEAEKTHGGSKRERFRSRFALLVAQSRKT
ncbi:alpha/beta-hydrolase, partial [Cristinia sonorae]